MEAIFLSDMILLTEQNEIGSPERERLRRLLLNTTFDEIKKADIEQQIEGCNYIQEYEEIELWLYMNRIQDKDRISMGLNFSYKDWKKTMKML